MNKVMCLFSDEKSGITEKNRKSVELQSKPLQKQRKLNLQINGDKPYLIAL